MKKLAFALLIVAFTVSSQAQKLLDIYKKGTVRLIPDTTYAQNRNWETIFKTYNDSMDGRPIGRRKSLIIMPDGSAVVNNPYRNFYTKFSPNGKFEKEFGIKNAKGQQFKKIEQIEGIMNNNTFFTGLDNMGNMNCFDFNGTLIKTMKLDYMTRQILPLSNNKLAVVGWSIWKSKIRDFVAIVDYKTGKEKVIWENFTSNDWQQEKTNNFHYRYTFKNNTTISFVTIPFGKSTGMSNPPLISSMENKLIVANPTSGEIMIFDLEGNKISKDKIGWATNYVSVKEQKEIQQSAIDKYKSLKNSGFMKNISPEENKAAMTYFVNKMEADLAKITEPSPIPTFVTILKDSDDNLLFFEYPKEEKANKFNVWIYENKGKFVCQSSFICDQYDLEINPSKLVFHKGYIYGLQQVKNSKGIPLRLVRFKIANN